MAGREGACGTERRMRMEQKFSIVCREVKRNLVSIINNAPLPPDAMAWILRDLANEMTGLAEEQYKKDLAELAAEAEKEQEKEQEDGNV